MLYVGKTRPQRMSDLDPNKRQSTCLHLLTVSVRCVLPGMDGIQEYLLRKLQRRDKGRIIGSMLDDRDMEHDGTQQ